MRLSPFDRPARPKLELAQDVAAARALRNTADPNGPSRKTPTRHNERYAWPAAKSTEANKTNNKGDANQKRVDYDATQPL